MKKINLETIKTIELQRGKFYCIFAEEQTMDPATAQAFAEELLGQGIANFIVLIKDIKGIKVIESPDPIKDRDKFNQWLSTQRNKEDKE